MEEKRGISGRLDAAVAYHMGQVGGALVTPRSSPSCWVHGIIQELGGHGGTALQGGCQHLYMGKPLGVGSALLVDEDPCAVRQHLKLLHKPGEVLSAVRDHEVYGHRAHELARKPLFRLLIASDSCIQRPSILNIGEVRAS